MLRHFVVAISLKSTKHKGNRNNQAGIAIGAKNLQANFGLIDVEAGDLHQQMPADNRQCRPK